MKIERITVNKSPERPNGVQIDLVQPETDLEASVLTFLIPAKLREAKQAGKLTFVLPERFEIEHKKDGTFIVAGVVGSTEYYQPPRPLAIVGLHRVGASFDIVHAPVDLDKLRKQQQQASRQSKKKDGDKGESHAEDETAAAADAGERPSEG